MRHRLCSATRPRCCTTVYGRYEEALAAAQRACEYEDLGIFGCRPRRAGRGGRPKRRAREAATALDHSSERTQASGTDWALGVEAGHARC